MVDLRIGDKNNFNQKSDQEENLPEVVEAGGVGILDDQIALTPVSLTLVFFLGVVRHNLVVIDLEEKLHEVFIAIAKLEIRLHVVLIQVFSQDLFIALDACLFSFGEFARVIQVPLLEFIFIS